MDSFSLVKRILTQKYNDLDFPFYRDNPRISAFSWTVFLLSLIIGVLVSAIFSILGFPEIISQFFNVALIVIPLLYYTNWDYSLFVHKPTRDELILAFLMFAGYIVYSLVMASFLDSAGLSVTDSTVTDSMISMDFALGLIFSIMYEELLKFIPTMFLMTIIYRLFRRRNFSFVVATILVITGFAVLHMGNGLTLIHVLLVQGVGSIFEVYGYAKTKNLLVSYISHLLVDVLIVFLTFFSG